MSKDPAFSTRQRIRRTVIQGAFSALANVGERSSVLREARKHVDCIRDVSYGPETDHKLDVYVPTVNARPMPVLLYIHGGAFTLCSKRTHRGIGYLNAHHAGAVVFNIDYRLAPEHRFPGAIEDACRAYRWVVENCSHFGGDPARIVVAGESAGGNLALGVALATSYKRPEPWARAVFDLNRQPVGVQPLMPYLQVSSPSQRLHGSGAGSYVRQLVQDIAVAYLGRGQTQASESNRMADPIRVLEECGKPERPLPPIYSGVGTADLCLQDVKRLQRACEDLGAECQVQLYPGEPHAFQVMRWRASTRKFWRDNFAFLAQAYGKELRRAA